MKTIFLALPLLIAVTVSTPSQAKDVTLRISNGEVTVKVVQDRFDRRDSQTNKKKAQRIQRIDQKPAPHVRPLTHRQITHKLTKQGYRNLQLVRSHGQTHRLKAVGRRGNPVNLVVHAYTGQVLDRQIVRKVHREGRAFYDQGTSGRILAQPAYPREPFWRR